MPPARAREAIEQFDGPLITLEVKKGIDFRGIGIALAHGIKKMEENREKDSGKSLEDYLAEVIAEEAGNNAMHAAKLGIEIGTNCRDQLQQLAQLGSRAENVVIEIAVQKDQGEFFDNFLTPQVERLQQIAAGILGAERVKVSKLSAGELAQRRAATRARIMSRMGFQRALDDTDPETAMKRNPERLSHGWSTGDDDDTCRHWGRNLDKGPL